MNKHQLLEVYQSRTIQISFDICRVLLIIIAIAIFYKLVTEIEAVKMLNLDPCLICMNKSGAICMFPNSSGTVVVTKYVYPKINFSNLDKLVNET